MSLTIKFSSTTPAAPSGYTNATYQETSSGGTDYISNYQPTWIKYGVRASLPASAPVVGAVYVCNDSPFSYVWNGGDWTAYIQGLPVTDPALDGTLVSKQTATPTSSSVTSTYGGVLVTATFGSDQVYAYVKPVTPSSTLLVPVNGMPVGQAGFVIWNNNTGNVVFVRTVGLSPDSYSGQLYYSRYTVSGGISANTNNVPWTLDWPSKVIYAFRFDGTNWYFEAYIDTTCATKYSIIFQEALTSWIGTNYTHIGFGVNNGGTIWGQHLKIGHV